MRGPFLSALFPTPFVARAINGRTDEKWAGGGRFIFIAPKQIVLRVVIKGRISSGAEIDMLDTLGMGVKRRYLNFW